MKRVGLVLAVSLTVFALLPEFGAAAVPTVVVRPGHLHGWVPSSGGTTSYGRWDTGPDVAPLGQGSVHLRKANGDRLQLGLGSVSGAGFKATFHVHGSGFASLYVRGSGGGTATVTPNSGAGWRTVNAMSSSAWHWDCPGGTTPTGTGMFDDFLTACDSPTITAVGFQAAVGTSWVDAATLGPAGNVKTYNFEPPTAKISDARVVEGDSGSKAMRFIVRLSGRNQDGIQMKFGTSGLTTVHGRACACEDFDFKISVLKIAPGRSSGVIKIVILGDTAKEPTETLTVRLSTHLDCVPTDKVGIGTIVNDD
jgi:hypothetical protein